MNFEKNRFNYLYISISVACLFFIVRGPFYEVLTDISVNPPENVRRTDFSWITVNEWFNSQAYLIKSHEILKNVKSDMKEERIKRIISVKRIGAADVIRISARSSDSISELTDLVENISTAYLANMGYAPGTTPMVSQDITDGNTAKIDMEYTENLKGSRAGITGEINRVEAMISAHEKRTGITDSELKKLQNTEHRAAEIDIETMRISQELDRLKKIYTENWASVSDLTAKLTALKSERELLVSGLEKKALLENEKIELKAILAEESRKLASLKSEAMAVDKKIDERTKAYSAGRATGPVISKAIEDKNRGEALIINPTTTNFLPELGIQVVYGTVVGSVLWFLAGMFLGKKKANGKMGTP